ncbi:unnamed protein product [Oikopleura dioica]|nr:unnamed protein product [Oikopleura dioica]
MKTIFAIDSYRHRTEIVDAIVVIVAIIVTVIEVAEASADLHSHLVFIILFTLRVIRLVNGVATLIITNLERKQDELKLKYKTELEKSTIMLLLHSMDEYEAKKKKDENTRPSVVAEITPVEHFNASCSLSSSSENENSSELQRRVTSTVKQMSIRNKKKNQKKALIHTRHEYEIRRMLEIRDHWVRQLEETMAKNEDSAQEILEIHASEIKYSNKKSSRRKVHPA